MAKTWDKLRKQSCLGEIGAVVGCLAAGAAAAAFLPQGAANGALAITGGTVASFLGKVGLSAATDIAKRFVPKKKPTAPDHALNHDIERVVGHAVTRVMAELVHNDSPHAALYAHLLKYNIPDRWHELMVATDLAAAELDLPNPQELMILAATARETGDGSALPPCLNVDTWRSWLVKLAPLLEGSQSFGSSVVTISKETGKVVADTEEEDDTDEAGEDKTFTQTALDELAAVLVTRFYWHVVEALKADFEQDGKAYAAIQMATAASTLSLVRGQSELVEKLAFSIANIETAINEKMVAIAPNLSPEDRAWIAKLFGGLSKKVATGNRKVRVDIANVNELVDTKTDAIRDDISKLASKILPPPPPTVAYVLPRLPDIYVRRVAKLEAIHQRLNAPGSVATAVAQVVATGFGGYGKSLLAIGYAYDYANEHFPCGAYFLPVGSISIETALEALGNEMGLTGMPDTTPAAAAFVCRHLQSLPARSLLIVDNVDADQWRDRAFRDRLPKGKVCLLVTTRDPNLLPPGHTVEVDRLTFEETIELLAHFRPDARLEENRAAVQRIYNALEGIAVGIAAVGAYLGIQHTLPFADYATVLENQSPDELPDNLIDVSDQVAYKPDWGGAAPNGRLVRALSDAFDAQSLPAQIILQLAAALPQDLAPRPWIEAVMKEWTTQGLEIPAVPGFADPLVPLFSKLAKGDFLRTSESAEQLLIMHRLHRALIRVRLRAAPERFLSLLAALARAAHARAPEWMYQGRWREPVRRWEVEPVIAFSSAFAADALAGSDRSQNALNIATLLADLAGRVELQLGRRAEARKSFERGLEIDRALLTSHVHDVAAHRNLSVSLNFLADLIASEQGAADALPLYTESLEIRRRIVTQFGETQKALSDVSISLDRVGDVELAESGAKAALPFYTESLEICRRIVTQFGETPQALRDVSVSLNKVGDVELAESRAKSALPFYAESLEICRRIVSQFGETPEALRDVSASLDRVGDVELAESGAKSALPFYAESLEIARQIDKQFGETPEALRDVATSLQRTGVTKALLGDKAAGLIDARAALAGFEEVGRRWGMIPQIVRDIAGAKALIARIEAM